MTVRHEKKRERLRIIGAHVRREFERTGRSAYEQYLARAGDVSLHNRINERARKGG